MKNSKGKAAIEKLARQKGISVQEVKEEIRIAIAIGLNSPDPAVRQYWAKIPRRGATPTPEEVVAYLARQV